MKRGPRRKLVALGDDAYARARLALRAVPDENWRSRGACRDNPQLWWFCDQEPKDDRAWMETQAAAVCWTCPVRQSCLAYALRHREPFGIWAGFNPDEIDRLRRTLHGSAIDMPSTATALVDSLQEASA